MPNPVIIPTGPLPLDAATNAEAEALLKALLRVMQYGTTGVSENTPPIRLPGGAVPDLSDPRQQLVYRQMAVAIASTISGGGGNPEPVPGDDPRLSFDATCTSAEAVGDLVVVTGTLKKVSRATMALLASTPVVGVVISKASSTTAVVQVGGVVRNIYSGLTPGATYFVGADGRPSSTLPTGTLGTELYVQHIGTAIDSTTLAFQPKNDIYTIHGTEEPATP